MRNNVVTLKAPLSGYLMPIERVPDPVFAQKMVGDGIALDPVSNALLAPCDGEVVQLHDAHHAVTLKSDEGIELLMHIGLDTVMLKSEGFLPHVQTGTKVKQGDMLIEFDPDYIATHAESLLTMIVVTNGEHVTELHQSAGDVEAGKDVIMTLTLADVSAEVEATTYEPISSEAILVPNQTGLHARPAAVLANMARKFQADIHLQHGDEQANAKSVVGIMNLNVGYQAKVMLIAHGPDAREAIDMLAPMIREGLGEEGAAPVPAPASVAQSELAAPPPRPRSEDPNIMLGVTASPGLAVGEIFQVRHQEINVAEHADDPTHERRRLDEAIAQSKIELETLQARLHGEADPAKAAIFAAHQELLDDPDLAKMTHSAIAKGKSAAFAWQTTIDSQADRLAALNNELLAARANDLRDVGRRVLQHLTGIQVEPLVAPTNSILIAEDLTPSDTANLDRARVLGFATTLGGATSHVAILARSLDIPAVAGIEARALDIPNGTPVILDGAKGKLRLNPPPEVITKIRKTQERLAVKRKAEVKAAFEPAVTRDGHALEVVANVSGLADAEQAIELGGEGVGLLRTEFLFMERQSAPSEDEQTEQYSAILKALGPNKPLVIRTLDVGGDKPLPYLPIPPEANPFLGERGVRIGLDRPEILRTQLRAILRASNAGKLLVMFPMIATLNEWQAAKGMFEEERKKLAIAPIPVGIMVEVPAAAIMAEQFAREADFFSIGTNDLTQYTLAMDRGHPKLAPQVDGLNPAVLQLIAHTVKGAKTHGKWVGVCGGIASDPQAVPLLIGLGVKELSVSVPAIPSIKALVRRLSLIECQALAQKALSFGTAAEVRALYTDELAMA
ncbi:MAG: phosphoenolpyruvate--protein phosphotransferase [Anaerolineae bacterium]|nr:phosphoenolpyruvate--protein phosphotransferase [Anaerolineae bacterium]